MSLVFFNLITNATFSLIAGLLVVGLFLWVFRVETGPWKVALLSLPFLKIVYDFVRGLPSNSILFSGVDPYTLPPKHQTLRVGAGFSEWGPNIDVTFSTTGLSGAEYTSSLGDYLAIWVHRTWNGTGLLMIVSTVCLISLALVVIRIIEAFKFESRRRSDRFHAHPISDMKVGSRRVDIYYSCGFSGTPFTGGLLKPYICIPQDAMDRLTPDELQAVIGHELAHINHWDLPVTVGIQLLGDLFWFVPGYRWLSRKIDELREIVADQWAVQRGVSSEHLASALLKLKEAAGCEDRFVLYSAFFRKKSLLKTRIEHLIGPFSEKPSRWGWRFRPVRLLAFVWIFMSVMVATLGGNHSGRSFNNPDWLVKILSTLGLS